MRTKKTKKGRSKTSKTKNQSKKSTKNVKNQQEIICLPDDVNYVRFEINGRMHVINIHDNIPIVEKIIKPLNDEIEKKPVIITTDNEQISLPVAKFRVIDDYEITDAPPRPTGYIRFIEKSADELDGEVEYDVDEEDTAWLNIINKKREDSGLSNVEIDVLELLMDRLEKESYFQATVTGQVHNVVDDDAVCCICNDGECQNTNVILFCDMCNLAVHQDCYGVPYIPEGQWLCRRCLQSPSRAVNCVLCPNIDGAFKQTDKGEWAHVVCALWIPEVRFANTVFLEPIDSIELIPAARWRLTCYICKRKGVGACIQCHKSNCYAAFHVTCAQYAALYMNMDTVTKHTTSVIRSGSVGSHNENSNDSVRSMPNVQSVIVRKIAYCHSHSPIDESNENLSLLRKKREQFSKKARMSLLKQSKTRCNPGPVIISIPTIPENRVQEICSLVNVSKKYEFIQHLIAYWTLKRQHRNGVPLLRRLQSQGSCRSADNRQLYKDVDTVELIRQIRYWQCLRQDLERARLLCELVRKRERLKLELIRVSEKLFLFQVNPVIPILRRLLQSISAKDLHEIFQEPVNVEEVPDYLTVVKNPIDLSTMRLKLERNEYKTVQDLKSDFELMINNCLTYNSPETIFYKIGVKMMDQCELFFEQANAVIGNTIKIDENVDFVEKKPPDIINENEYIENIQNDVDRMTGSYSVEDFEKLLERCKTIPINNLRKLLSKRVQSRLVRARNRLRLAQKSNSHKKTDNKNEDDEKLKNEETMELRSKSSETRKSIRSVSRRTAVLLTRKSKLSDSTRNSKRLTSTTSVKKEEEAPNNIRSENERQLRSKKTKTLDEVDEKTGEGFTKYRNSEQINSDVETDASGYSTCYSRTVSDVEKEDEVKYQLPDKRIIVRKRKKRTRTVMQKRRRR